jgi:hypothetical protein
LNLVKKRLEFDLVETKKKKCILSKLEGYQKVIDEFRTQRQNSVDRLEWAITKRENLLQIVHYLQSLKSLVLHPPDAPSRALSSVPLPSIDKAIAANRAKSYSIDNQSTVTGSEVDESQSFVAAMLDQTMSQSQDLTDGNPRILVFFVLYCLVYFCITNSFSSESQDIFNIRVPPTITGRKTPNKTLGPPPQEIHVEFEKVVTYLEALWEADIKYLFVFDIP